MDLETVLNEANPNLVIFLLTTLIAFVSWLLKSLIENPINESKTTFNKFLDKRIEILTEVKSRLNFIAYFPKGDDSLNYKNQLQEIILKDGRTGYLNKETFDSILKIAINPETNETLLLETIKKIDEDLYLQISKIQDEISFYRRFSNYNPIKRFVGLTLLTLQYIISFALVIVVLFFLIYLFFEFNLVVKIILVLFLFISVYLLDKYLK